MRSRTVPHTLLHATAYTQTATHELIQYGSEQAVNHPSVDNTPHVS